VGNFEQQRARRARSMAAPSVAMFTDASMRGWGADWNGQVAASGFFAAANKGSSINELELLAAIHGLRAFARFARSRELVPISDSLVTVHIVRNFDVTCVAPPFSSTDAARAMRVPRCYHVYPTPPFRTESMCRTAVPPPGQYVLGPVSHFRHVTGAPFKSRASRWRDNSPSACRINRPSSNRLSSFRPSASLASPPCRRQARFCSAKTTKPPYSSLIILVLVLLHLIVCSETALVA
jgi:hypothetical protein